MRLRTFAHFQEHNRLTDLKDVKAALTLNYEPDLGADADVRNSKFAADAVPCVTRLERSGTSFVCHCEPLEWVSRGKNIRANGVLFFLKDGTPVSYAPFKEADTWAHRLEFPEGILTREA